MFEFCYPKLYLGIGTVSYCLLLRIARMEMDCNLNKLAQLFQVLIVPASLDHYTFLGNCRPTPPS